MRKLSLIPEIIVEGKRLGRHRDLRAGAHRAAAGPPPLATELKSVKHVSGPGMPLDQGDVGSCTANALCGALNTAPHWSMGAPVLNEKSAVKAYSLEEKDLFGTPYPPTDNGGSGQAVCEAAEQLGWCNGFQIARGIQEAILALVLRPVITGVNWYTSFDEPPADAIVSIAPGATVRGGHELVATELIVPEGVTVENLMSSLEQIQVGLWQSWGLDYGLQGRFYWTAATWRTLLEQGGDVTVPRTRKGWVADQRSFLHVIEGGAERAVEKLKEAL